MGTTRTRDSQHLAGNLLRLARKRSGLSQRQLAEAAGVPQSTVARIETYRQQPTLPLLGRLFAAAGLELRTRLESETGVRIGSTDVTTVRGLAERLSELIAVDLNIDTAVPAASS